MGISVSRVGGNAQVPAMKKVAGSLRLDLASFRELEDFARLGTELDPVSQSQLDRGYRMVELLKQPQFAPKSVPEQVISVFAASNGALDDIDVSQVQNFLTELLAWIRLEANEYVEEIETTGKMTDTLAEELLAVIEMYKNVYRFSFGA